jgi:aspartyl-tRNA(Asn)/glutamyl-tRNA(Gln) amidotransferase subunit C
VENALLQENRGDGLKYFDSIARGSSLVRDYDQRRLGRRSVGSIETLTLRRRVGLGMSDDAVSPEEVRHVAELARVDLADDEVDQFARQFADILEYFETLDEVPAVDREADLTNVMRPDEERDSLDRGEALRNAPETEDGYFKGPNVS